MGVHRVSVREFKARLSHYLNQAEAGEVLEITSHRRVVARVVGAPKIPEGASPKLAQAIASGAFSWSGGKPKGASLRLSEGGPTLSEIVLADRD